MKEDHSSVCRKHLPKHPRIWVLTLKLYCPFEFEFAVDRSLLGFMRGTFINYLQLEGGNTLVQAHESLMKGLFRRNGWERKGSRMAWKTIGALWGAGREKKGIWRLARW